MKEANQSINKQIITYIMPIKALARAERALARLKCKSKSNFAKSISMSSSTVTKFFEGEPIQFDSFQRICQELKLSDWQEVAVIKKKERFMLLEIKDCSSPNFLAKIENMSISSKNQDNEAKKWGLIDKWPLVTEIVNHSVVNRSLSSVDLSDADLSDADLSRADLRSSDLSDADLSHADLRGADLRDTNLSSAILKSAYLNGANLRGANLRGANLNNTNLSNANLSNTYLNGSNLKSVDLICANLSNANLSNANLSNAYLRGANLSNANLSNANLSGTNLNNTEVENTRFGNNLGISESLKLDLIARGAIFEDSPEDRSEVLTSA